MAQSCFFWQIAPYFDVILWHNLDFFVTLRHSINLKSVKKMESAIIGRKSEIKRLKAYVESDKSEFIAIYGRRRVGKTFLIKELLDNQLSFRMIGRENASLATQLTNFSYAMSDYFDDNSTPKNWTEAFRL